MTTLSLSLAARASMAGTDQHVHSGRLGFLSSEILYRSRTPYPRYRRPHACSHLIYIFSELDCLLKGVVGTFGSVEFDDGGTAVFHCIFTYTVCVTYGFRSWPAIVAWFVLSGVGLLPNLKGRGIRLVPPVKALGRSASRAPRCAPRSSGASGVGGRPRWPRPF